MAARQRKRTVRAPRARRSAMRAVAGRALTDRQGAYTLLGVLFDKTNPATTSGKLDKLLGVVRQIIAIEATYVPILLIGLTMSLACTPTPPPTGPQVASDRAITSKAPVTPDPACTNPQVPTVNWAEGLACVCAPWQRKPDLNGNVAVIDTAHGPFICHVREKSTPKDPASALVSIDIVPGQRACTPTPAGAYGNIEIVGWCAEDVAATATTPFHVLVTEDSPVVGATFQGRPPGEAPRFLPD